jgi:hypothetical protein
MKRQVKRHFCRSSPGGASKGRPLLRHLSDSGVSALTERMLQRLASYPGTLVSMNSERVTVSLPSDLMGAAREVAERADLPFSAVVAEALTSWLRGRLVDAWLADYQTTHGAFSEEELERLATDAGVPYLPPQRVSAA